MVIWWKQGTHRELLARRGCMPRLVNVAAGIEDHLTVLADVRSSTVDQQSSTVLADVRPSTFDLQPPPNDRPAIKNHHSPFFRLLGFLRGSWGWVALSVLLGVLTVGSNVGLMGTSAFLISSAALHPELAALQAAIVGVRFFGIARGVFRYLERLVSHASPFACLPVCESGSTGLSNRSPLPG